MGLDLLDTTLVPALQLSSCALEQDVNSGEGVQDRVRARPTPLSSLNVARYLKPPVFKVKSPLDMESNICCQVERAMVRHVGREGLQEAVGETQLPIDSYEDPVQLH